MFEFWGILKSIAAVVGFFRLVCKPIMTILQAAVEQTETKTDDLILEKVLGSRAYSIFKWVLDYLGSIKLDTTQKVFKAKK